MTRTEAMERPVLAACLEPGWRELAEDLLREDRAFCARILFACGHADAAGVLDSLSMVKLVTGVRRLGDKKTARRRRSAAGSAGHERHPQPAR